jgi:hypothetical protein
MDLRLHRDQEPRRSHLPSIVEQKLLPVNIFSRNMLSTRVFKYRASQYDTTLCPAEQKKQQMFDRTL